jgi:hypothetical protein
MKYFKQSIILDFIYKLFFILKAASDGYIVKYIGGNKYDFIKYHKKKSNSTKFLKKYIKSIPQFLH